MMVIMNGNHHKVLKLKQVRASKNREKRTLEIHFRVSEAEYDRIYCISREAKLTVSALMRLALFSYLENICKKPDKAKKWDNDNSYTFQLLDLNSLARLISNLRKVHFELNQQEFRCKTSIEIGSIQERRVVPDYMKKLEGLDETL